MITKQAQVDILQKKWRELKADNPTWCDLKLFNEYADIELYEKQTQAQRQAGAPHSAVYGIVQNYPAQIVPVKGVKSITASQSIDFYVPEKVKQPDGTIQTFDDIYFQLNEFAEFLAGETGTEGTPKTAYLIAANAPTAGVLSQDAGWWAIPVTMMLTWSMIEGGVISNSVGLKIDTEEVVLLDFKIQRTRVTETANFADSQELKSDVIQQGLSFSVATPLLNSGASDKIYNDALAGALGTTYNIEVFTAGRPERIYTYKVLATQIVTHLAPGTIGSLSVEFTLSN